MRLNPVRWLVPFAAGLGLGATIRRLLGEPRVAEAAGPATKSRTASLAMQFAGRGRLEGHPPGELDGVRFEGRFVIFAMTGEDGPLFSEDVSLHDAACVEQHGRGPQSAHFVAVRSGYCLEGFVTDGEKEFVGNTIGRTSSNTRLRIFFDAQPDGTRDFEDRASFLRGELVAVYKAEEFFQIDPRGGVFDTRVNYTLLESKPFSFMGRTVNLANVAPRMAELSHGHNPEPDPEPEAIPHEEGPYFTNRGPGTFADRFPVGGTLFAVG